MRIIDQSLSCVPHSERPLCRRGLDKPRRRSSLSDGLLLKQCCLPTRSPFDRFFLRNKTKNSCRSLWKVLLRRSGVARISLIYGVYWSVSLYGCSRTGYRLNPCDSELPRRTKGTPRSADGANGTSCVSAGDVSFWGSAPVISTSEMLKGFGCRQAYESLSCRNPRAADDYLWGFGPRGVPAPVATFRIGCGGDVVEAASGPGRRAGSVDSDGIGVRDDRRHGNVHITSR
jgi:hypothetical protein